MTHKRKLSDILSTAAGGNNIRDLWNSTQAAKEFEPLPAGDYVARIVRADLEESRSKATPGVKLEFAVAEGSFAGRKFWHDLWLTPAALAITKRDLAKLGVSELTQLEQPLPPGIICKVKLILRTDDDGTTHNKVRAFEVIRIEAPKPDEFAPGDETELPESELPK